MKKLKKTIDLLNASERKRGLLIVLILIIMSILEAISVASVMPFLAILGDPSLLETNLYLKEFHILAKSFGVMTSEDFLVFLGLLAFIFIIFSAVYRTFARYVVNRFVEMRRHTIGSRLLETFLRQNYSFFLKQHSGDMSKKILSDTDQLIANVFRPALNIISYGFVLIAITTVLVLTNPMLAFSAAGVMSVLYAGFYFLLRPKLGRMGESLVSANKERFVVVSEVLGGIKVIKLLGRESTYLSRFDEHSKIFSKNIALHQTINQVPKYLIEGLAFGGIIFVVVYLMFSHGGLKSSSLGQILPIVGLYAFAAYRLQPAVQAIFSGFSSLRYGEAVVDSIHKEVRLCSDLPELQNSHPRSLKAKKIICFCDVSFSYANSRRASLKKINLEVLIGSTVGIVGSTGSGKTTFVDVLLGLLHPTKGQVTVDGLKICNENLKAWQSLIGYVPQEIFLTDASITENIALGVPKTHINLDQIENCARMAQIHDFIVNELPSKYETLVGERGVRLSGGQRQRIGIARALYHAPEILIFDEATSALDTVTEKYVMQAIDALSKQKTIFLIAHRLSTVRNCDQIILLQDGVIKAKGTYDEVIVNNAHF